MTYESVLLIVACAWWLIDNIRNGLKIEKILKAGLELRVECEQVRTESDRVTHHNRDLQAKIAELESERRAYDLTVANCDHLRAENERLEKQLEMLTFINSQLGIKQLGKPPRVRDDEAND